MSRRAWPPLLGALFGALAVLLARLVAQGGTELPLLLGAGALLGAAAFGALGVLRPASKREAPPSPPPSLLLDSSALIDGRLVRVAEAGFLPARLGLPDFVLAELQRLADASDDETRRRGRRGLATLKALRELPSPSVDVLSEPTPTPTLAVDARLVALAKSLGAGIVTTDFNLQQVASAHGVASRNPHQLASAMKAPHRRGERLELTLVRPGRERGQALGYLDDGTMVVVEGGADAIGSEVEVVVSGSAQSDRGLLLFAKPSPTAALDAPPGST